MQAPSIPYDPAKGFTLVDCWTAVDVKLDGIAFQSNQSVPCTLYSNQVFTGAQNIDVTVTLLDLLGAMVGVGILGERSIEGCRSNAVGHSDIGDSIGCAVGRNQVLIVFKGRTLYRGEANTTGRTEVRFELVNGRASFSVDGKKCVCPELTALNLTKGKFRLGLSPMKEGQTGLIGDVAAYVRLFGADTKVPVVAYDVSKGLSFHDRWRSIDVKDGRELKCNAACQATCYSEQTFKGSVAMRQSLTLVRRGAELIAFGILGAGSTKHCSDFVLGEREIPESVGCLIKGDDIAIMYKDDLIFREEKKLRTDPCVSVLLVDGKLYFEVDEKRIDCPALAQLNFKDTVLRLGASLTGKGQVCLLNSSPATKDGSVDPFAPNIGFNSEFGFSFHERSTAFTRVENSRRIIAQTDNTSTVYSSQVINGSTRTKQVVRIFEKGQGKIVFGLIDAVTTSSSERAAADQITMRGITICLKGDEAVVTNQGEVIHTQKVSYTKPQTEIAFTLGGNIKIEVDGVHIVNDKIAGLNIANKHYRLGVSVSEKGQIVELITKGAGPPLPDGFVEGDRDLRYKWACWPDHAHTLGDSVTGKQKGSLAFSLETVFSRKVTGSVCSSCYRGEPNRRVFDCADWKCSECDWHLCNDCHYNGNVKHVHDRKSFRATPGGVMHEVRMSIGELLGNVIDFGVVPHGLETTFGEVPGTFVTGGSSGWTNGSQGVTTPLKNGDEIWVRVFNNTLSILCNRKLVHTSTIEIQPYRVAIRFGRDGQTVNMINRFITPPRGTCVAITPDRWFLEQECRLVGLDASCLPHDVRAWLVGEDSDGTVRVCVDEGAVPAIWIPKTTIVPVPNRAVPPPSVCQLPDGTKVVRNLATWIFADQDGGTKGNRIGQVMGTDADGWVRVRWSNGKENIYRYTRGIYVVTAWVGNIGDKVTRNPAFWCAGGADGYGVGVVQSSTAEGILTVQWENGATTLCKFNEDAQEVQLAGPLKVPPLSAAADPDVPGEKKTIVAPPMPAANGQPAPVDRADLARIAEQETLLEVGVKPAMKLKPGYKPPDVLSKCMLDAAAALPRITQMPYIVEECIPIAEQRRKYNNNALELDESLAIVLYTYDLGTMSSSPVGNDNFYFVLNDTFRSRDSQALFALQPFLYNFKMAWNKLPNQAGTFYRGIPKSATESIMKMYTAGREIYWSSITSLSTDRHVAEHIFARKEGPGGVLMEIIVSESRAISAYSAIPRENEVILEPNTKLVVVQPPTPTPGCEHYILKLLQVKPEKPFVF